MKYPACTGLLAVCMMTLGACGPAATTLALAGGSARQIVAIETPNILKVIGPPPGGALATSQKQQIAAFIDSYTLQGVGLLTLMIPTVRDGASANSNSVRQVYNAVISSGADPQFIERQRYYASSANDFQITYRTYQTDVPGCANSDWSNVDASRSYGGQPAANFGCAVSVNIARMIADPRDAIGPAPATPPDSYRRQEVLSGYRQGQSTASQRSQGEQGNARAIVN